MHLVFGEAGDVDRAQGRVCGGEGGLGVVHVHDGLLERRPYQEPGQRPAVDRRLALMSTID